MLKKYFLIAFLLLFTSTLSASSEKRGEFLGGKHTQMPSWFNESFLDLNEDIEELASQNKKLILYLHQDNCPYCNLFITKNLANENLKQKILKNFAITDINMFGDRDVVDVDGEELTEKEFAIKHKIQFTPTLIFFDQKGKQALRLNGYANIKKLNTAIDYIKNKTYKLMPFKEYLVENNKTGILISEPELFKRSNNFIREGKSKKMAIFFESSTCEDCKTLHYKLLKDKTTRKLLKQLDNYQIDMNSTKSVVTPKRMITKINKWMKDLNITHTPTVIFFDEKGKEIIRVESLFKNFHFQTIVDYVVSDAYKEEKEFQRYLTKRANNIRDKGIDVNIWD